MTRYPPFCNARQRRKIRRLGLKHVFPKNGMHIMQAKILDLYVQRLAMDDQSYLKSERDALFESVVFFGRGSF